MAQQINLHRPILLKPKLLFSATAIAQATAIFSLAVVLACVWVSGRVKAFQEDSRVTEQRYTQERDRLLAALAVQPASGNDVNALQQQLKSMQDALAQQRLSLQDMHLGRTIGNRNYSAILKLLSDTVPPPAWITDVAVSIERLEITGMTLDPAALQGWSARLAAHPLLQGQRLAAVRVERSSTALPGPQVGAPREAWAFTLVTDGTSEEAK
jgi:Tfp pilus assembly protein PilN